LLFKILQIKKEKKPTYEKEIKAENGLYKSFQFIMLRYRKNIFMITLY